MPLATTVCSAGAGCCLAAGRATSRLTAADQHLVLTALVIGPMILGGTAGVLAVVVIARIVLAWAMDSS